MTKPTPREVFDSWDKLVRTVNKQGQLILDLIAHPDATAEQIMQAGVSYRETRAALRKHKPVLVAWFAKQQGFTNRMFESRVAEVKV